MSDIKNADTYQCVHCGHPTDEHPIVAERKKYAEVLCSEPTPAFIEAINAFERNFRYPDEIHFDPEFWLTHAHQQVEEAEESFEEGDREHMVVELGDTILVCWRAMQIFGSDSPETVLRERMDLNLDEKGADAIMEKYTEWWRSLQGDGGRNSRNLDTGKQQEAGR